MTVKPVLPIEIRDALDDSLDGKPEQAFLQEVAVAIATHAIRNLSGERFRRAFDLAAKIQEFLVWSELDHGSDSDPES